MYLFCLVFAMSLCASVYMCFVVNCWERADLLALVCGVYCVFVTFPFCFCKHVTKIALDLIGVFKADFGISKNGPTIDLWGLFKLYLLMHSD